MIGLSGSLKTERKREREKERKRERGRETKTENKANYVFSATQTFLVVPKVFAPPGISLEKETLSSDIVQSSFINGTSLV